jgi:hypothetical protein
LLDAIGRIDLIGAKRDHDTRPRNRRPSPLPLGATKFVAMVSAP